MSGSKDVQIKRETVGQLLSAKVEPISPPKEVSTVSKVLSLFECCVCLDFTTPPILQCTKGHLFCHTCRHTLPEPAKCPTCGVAVVQDIHATALEKVAKLSRLRFRCKWHRYGCKKKTLLKTKQDHQEQCQYRPFMCSEFYMDNLLWECHWSGSADLLVQHLIYGHGLPIFNLEDKLDIICNIDFELKDCLWETLFIYKEEVFLFMMAKREELFNALVVLIGEQNIADQFWYRLEVEIDSNGNRLKSECRPKSIRHIQSLLFSVDGLHFTEQIARQWIQNKFLHIVVDLYQ